MAEVANTGIVTIRKAVYSMSRPAIVVTAIIVLLLLTILVLLLSLMK